MNIRESVEIGMEGIRSHKMRSILTALGIIFGVAAVIAMLSIGEGAKQEALEQIQLMGMNNILINDIPIENEEDGTGRTNLSRGLALEDATALQTINPLLSVAIPERSVKSQLYYGQESVEATVVGTMPEYERVMAFSPQQGAFFNYEDVSEARRVCVLGAELRWALFLFQDPVGQRIKIGQQWYTVLGVMEEKPSAGAGSGISDNLNNNVYIPITAAVKRFPRSVFASEIDRIIVQVKDSGRIQEAATVVKASISRRHNLVNDFTITIPEALLRQKQQTQRIFNIVMGAIAGISLLVGGIGIMNIMLASVMERTREIGVRRAVGARQLDILGQFLVEAMVLSFVGGLLGVVLGFILTKVIALYAGWRTLVSFSAIILAFTVSAAVGIIFGIYPARQAAKLDPIVSLRYE
ncbi:MAG TPA: ABC transporter permease [bacterium]|nr:ABC transporter permease [bacterium]HPR86927.1 ABC transporter permease [bacterium]